MIRVYHGRGLNKGTPPMYSHGFFVTKSKKMAKDFFGPEVFYIDVDEEELMPDPEQEAEQDRKLTGEESLNRGSAMLPHSFYRQLKPLGR